MNMVRELAGHVFERGSNKYAFDSETGICMKLPESTYRVLQDIEANTGFGLHANVSPAASKDPGIAVLISNNLVLVENPTLPKESYRQLSVSFAPIRACNLRCAYCFCPQRYEGSEIPTGLATAALEHLLTAFCDSVTVCRVDFVSGGEPLSDLERLSDLVARIRTTNGRHGVGSLFWLCTNGTYFGQSALDFVAANRIGLGVSIDGPQSRHDALRPYRDGTGSYSDVVEGLAVLRAYRRYGQPIRGVTALSVLTPRWNDVVEVVSHNLRLGFDQLQIKLARHTGSGIGFAPSDIDRLSLSYCDLVNLLKAMAMGDHWTDFVALVNPNDYFGKLLLRVFTRVRVDRRCNAGINKFAVDSEGAFYPCDSFVGLGSHCLGDARSGLDHEQYLKFAALRTHAFAACTRCWARGYCGGDCFHNSYIRSGSVDTPDPAICRLNRILLELVVELVVWMARETPRFSARVFRILAQRMKLVEADEKVWSAGRGSVSP